MSRRTERRDRLTSPQEKPIHAFFIPHGDFDGHLLRGPHEAADRMLTDNPGKRVAIHSEAIDGVDSVARAASEAVLRGKGPKEAWVDANYKYLVQTGQITHSSAQERASKTHYHNALDANPFASQLFDGLKQVSTKHPGRVLWISEGSSPDVVEVLANPQYQQDEFGVPILRSTGSTSYEEFVNQKIGAMRELGSLHRRRDNKVKNDVRNALNRRDVIGSVLWRGTHHQHIADELLDEGYSVNVTADEAGDSQRLFFTPGEQLFREMMADPTREVSDEELDIAIKGTLWYDGSNQEMLGHVAEWAENRKGAAGIETLGQRELITIRSSGQVDEVGSDYVPKDVLEYYVYRDVMGGKFQKEDFLDHKFTPEKYVGKQNPDYQDAQRDALRPPDLGPNVTCLPNTGFDDARALMRQLHPTMDPDKLDMIAATLQSATDKIGRNVVREAQDADAAAEPEESNVTYLFSSDRPTEPALTDEDIFPGMVPEIRNSLTGMFETSFERAEAETNEDAKVIPLFGKHDAGTNASERDEDEAFRRYTEGDSPSHTVIFQRYGVDDDPDATQPLERQKPTVTPPDIEE